MEIFCNLPRQRYCRWCRGQGKLLEKTTVFHISQRQIDEHVKKLNPWREEPQSINGIQKMHVIHHDFQNGETKCWLNSAGSDPAICLTVGTDISEPNGLLNDVGHLTGLHLNLVVAVYEKKWWLGKVIEISEENNDAKVHFMVPHGPAAHYWWGNDCDKCFVPAKYSLGILPSELLLPVGTSSRTFRIEDDLTDEITRKYAQLSIA